MVKTLWQPPDFNRPDSGVLGEMKILFRALFHPTDYGELADDISGYWVQKLKDVWDQKPESIKAKDLKYNSQDPLSRIEQTTVLIAYADSVSEPDQPTLASLDYFLKTHFPAIRGLHLLPACEMSNERFNDGGFSQINRDRIHSLYGSNARFEKLMEKYFSMADFVLNHVDIDHPEFQDYLKGNDRAGDCFYVFSEEEYQIHLAKGDFEAIFRPRPFPLFTIFRRKPRRDYADLPHPERVSILNKKFVQEGLEPLPDELIHILCIFQKIKNDQMLLATDYRYVALFREYLSTTLNMNPDELFRISKTQETQHVPYIFDLTIQSLTNLLAILFPFLNIPSEKTKAYADIFQKNDGILFGESIRALTTFSHVQVDLNTATYEGLKLLIDDFSWYLKMDINMLRLDAANFAFKKWGTSCFGLPEVKTLMQILYLSMDAVSPRIVPNLEVNAPLSTILRQMADKQAPPPMMYDFHLASMLPVIFNTGDALPLRNISDLVGQYDIPHTSIRFSLDESHDGKSVNGSGGADSLLTYAQRKNLIDTVRNNGGYIKFKSSTPYVYPADEFKKICREVDIDPVSATSVLFEEPQNASDVLKLKKTVKTSAGIARALKIEMDRLKENAALSFFIDKILNGKEPYELCVSTRDSLKKTDDPFLEAKRYLAFKTLSFALMARHVKAIYFNDLMGLPNNDLWVKQTGELRNIKRTRSGRQALEQLISDSSHMEYWIAKQMNHLVALVDSDPAFHPRGREARIFVHDDFPQVAFVSVSYQKHHTLVLVNTSEKILHIDVQLSHYDLDPNKILVENISQELIPNDANHHTLPLKISPFGRYWIKNEKVEINQHIRHDVHTEDEMREALFRQTYAEGIFT